MGYIEKNLRNDEKVIMHGRPSWICAVPSFIAGVIAIIIGIVAKVELGKLGSSSKGSSVTNSLNYVSLGLMGIMFLLAFITILKVIIIILTTHLVLTDKRVIGKQGVLKVESMDVPVDKITSVKINQTFFGRILGYSTIVLTGVNSDYKFVKIGKGQEFKNAVTDAIDERQRVLQQQQAAEIAKAMGK